MLFDALGIDAQARAFSPIGPACGTLCIEMMRHDRSLHSWNPQNSC